MPYEVSLTKRITVVDREQGVAVGEHMAEAMKSQSEA
jgi:hypothetical protein